jgi:hypothetical protein
MKVEEFDDDGHPPPLRQPWTATTSCSLIREFMV